MSAYESCPCPKTSPWGKIQEKRELAPGIWTVSTAGHGGVKLSRERNAAMPDYMRNEGGWYEEDCEWAKAAVVHPIGFQRHLPAKDDPFRFEMEIAYSTLKNWHPDCYEKFFGCELQRGESLVRDEQLFLAENVNNFVLTSAWGDWAHWVPKGKVGVCARRASDRAEKWFLVDVDSYNQRHGQDKRGKFVIDPARDTEIEKPEKP